MSYSQEIKKHSKKGIPAIVLLCSAAYMVSYITRINYSAVVVEMIADGSFTQAQASLPLTALFIVYGLGQLVSGWLGDKFPPEKVIAAGLILTSVFNLSMPLLKSVAVMTVVWGGNGFAQALMWPPMVKLLSSCLTPYDYRKNIVYISYSAQLGTILMYLLAPVIISLASWRMVFYISSAAAVIMIISWLTLVGRLKGSATQQAAVAAPVRTENRPMPPYLMATLGVIVVSVAMQGILKDGIATWMPSYITDVFKTPSTVSILTGVTLPIFSIVVVGFSGWLFRRVVKNEALCAVVLYLACSLAIGVLSLAGSASPVLSVSMLMLANAGSHGINLMYTCMVIPHFTVYGRTSFITGLINSATYVGSALSMYGVAIITRYFGWPGTILSWLVVSLIGMLFSALAIKGLKNN